MNTRLICTLLATFLIAGCAATPGANPSTHLQIPVLSGWYDGQPVLYLTTDISDAAVARDKGANFVPRLADALPPAPGPMVVQPRLRSAVDKVYAVTNFSQGSVFASAPAPVGPASADKAYTPLWQMVTVTWQAGHTPRPLTSQEQVLAAAEQGQVRLEETRVVLNCPIVQHAGTALPGTR